MRNLGWLMVVAGIAAFFYCGQEAARFEPLPPGMGVTESLETDRGRWDTGRYAGAAIALTGLLLAMMPQGRG
jgi:hypothetical protein